MEINQLITFVTIAKCQSFSKAATKLDYSQAAVTIQIKNLEKELQCQLFDRLGKQVSLTARGSQFYPHAMQILKDLAIAKESIASSDELHGFLRLGTIDSLCASLSHLLLHYHKQFPHVTMSITTTSIDGLLMKLKQNEIDIAYLADRQIEDIQLMKAFEKEEAACFVCDTHHPLLQEKNLSFDQILAQPLILTERNASYRTLLDLDLQKKGYEVHPIIESENTDLILSMIQNTQNITFLPYYLIQPYIKDGTLAKLPLDYTIPITRQLLYHKEKWVSPEMQAFIALLD